MDIQERAAVDFPVVCVGASAGGLEAFKLLVSAIPPGPGMAFLIMQHFDAGYHSTLPNILRPLTTLAVGELPDDCNIEKNNIYIVPNDKYPVVRHGGLKLEKRQEKTHPHLPIDHFFCTVAEIFHANTYGILLTGMGTDGSLGLQKIKELGGVTFAQHPDSASYASMPLSAIDAQVVDFVLEPDRMPAKLVSIQQLITEHPGETGDDKPAQVQDDAHYKKVLDLLRIRKGVDFSYYKQTTIRRRVLRRMIVMEEKELGEYVRLLEQHPKEQETLYQDLLIPVTSFFRDSKIFETLCSNILPGIVKQKQAGEPLRIWIAGCSTGEEAYSVAICLHEFFGEQMKVMKVQLFATDLSEEVILKARRGMYTKREVENVSDSRLQQYFSRIDSQYQLTKNIRDLCVFARHNFLTDPPFAKMDFVSCRNVLIYMQPHLQKKALNTFHYALNEKGILLLSKSETAGTTPELFTALHKQEKFYQKKAVAPGMLRHLPNAFEKNLSKIETAARHGGSRKEDYEKNADDIFLSRYIPAAVVVNEQLEIVQFRGATGAFLEAAPGKASLNILKMAKEGLSFEIRNALRKASDTRESFFKQGILLQGGKASVSIEVVPLLQTTAPHFLIVFKPDPPPAEQLPQGFATGTDLVSQRVKQLENDLARLREEMRSVTEDLEAANEELQIANEELLSGSEELQSLNEELETSKEELQRTNEELMTINQELYDRNNQYNQARQYSEAIVNTVNEPLLVLNRDLRIKSANPAFYEMFQLTDPDITGKILFELQNNSWDLPELRSPLLNIQSGKLNKAEWEVPFNLPGAAERFLFLSAQPVHTHSAEELILLALKDITLQKTEVVRLQASASALEKELKIIETFFKETPALFCILKGPEHIFEFVNPRYSAVSGGAELIGKPFAQAFPEAENQGYKAILDQVLTSGEPYFGESMKATHFPGTIEKEVYVDFACQAYNNDDGVTEGVMLFAYEVTSQVAARHLLENNASILETTVNERTNSLVEANAALEKSNRNLQAFASIASHDLQEPLRKIKTFLGILRRRYAQDFGAEANTLFQKTEAASVRMSNLIRDVLSYSRISMPDKNFIPCKLNDIVQNVLEDFELLIAEKRVIVQLRTPLPEMECIPSQMNQLFYNLIGNALKFSALEREPEIDISCQEILAPDPDDDFFVKGIPYYSISIKDNGIGFDQSYATQIFSIFERLNNASQFEGTGIGLALCLRIVQFHNGRITAQGQPGVGSIFTLVLPGTQTGTNVVKQFQTV